MRKIFYLLLLPALVLAQQTNYTKTTTYKIATTTSILNPTSDDARQIMVYKDGFGRPIQKIFHQQSNLGNDIVLPIEYDGMGRQVKQYLPYVNSAPSLNYNSNAASDQSNYPEYIGQYPYSEIVYERSSLNRVMMTSSPGADWSMNAGHEIKFEYKNNVDDDEVKLFIATASWEISKGLYDIGLTQSTYYPANTLYKKITKNEDWVSGSGTDNTTEEFTDKSGRVVLKRSYNANEILDTYYVYDQFGNLTYVIPPKADMTISQIILDKLCYQYKYDDRNRLVEKKVPGKQWEYIVYDKLDRVVATGPVLPPFSGLTAPGWIITKYDDFNRPILTGWISVGSANFNNTLRKNLQTSKNGETIMNESRNNSTPDVNVGGIIYGYTNFVTPISGYHVLTVTYYDDYNYTNPPSLVPQVLGQPVFYNNTNKPIGKITGQLIRASKTTGSDRCETGYVLYDEKARPIRAYMKNHEIGVGGYTQQDTQFNFNDQIEYTETLHKRINSNPLLKIQDFYTYSSQGRKLTHFNQITNGATTFPIELISSNTYNELGNLISKNVGNTLNNPLQKVDYSYNIKGWLTEINKINGLAQSGDPTDLFAFKINFNDVNADINSPTIAKHYNGNVSETYWISGSDNTLRKYAYKYDFLDRLIHAYYRLPNASSPSVKSYDENASYDKNGNIMRIHRNGDVEGSNPPIEIDELEYIYEADTNKLLRVTETIPTQTSGFSDGTNSGDDYSYDVNGNLTKDENKGIVNGSANAIIYNHLNLPIKIFFGTTATIEYIYDAVGNKLEKTFTQGATQTTTKYLNGFQYVNDVLQFFPTEEGYVTKMGNNFRYVYQYKDHLGNVRLSYSLNTTTGNPYIIEESSYYPFGLKHSGYNGTILAGGNAEAQKYKFQEQERQEEMGLNWDSFKWRNYDYTLGRFMSIDPLTESYSEWSPYAFSGNQIINSRELEGLEPYTLFKSQREAATNFAQAYSGLSIMKKREIGTLIYEKTNKDGSKSYGYVKPVMGKSKSVNVNKAGELPKEEDVIYKAIAHTHGSGDGLDYNSFSGTPGVIHRDKDGLPDDDISISEVSRLDGYVATPNSSLLEYNYQTNEITELDNYGVAGDHEGDSSTPLDAFSAQDALHFDYIDGDDGDAGEVSRTVRSQQRSGQASRHWAFILVLAKYGIPVNPDGTTTPSDGGADGDDDSYD